MTLRVQNCRTMETGWRTFCKSEAANKFPVCFWNERECCLAQLVPSKYLSKNNQTQGHHYFPPPFYLPLLLLMFGQKQTELEPMHGESPERHTGLQYILSSPNRFWFLSQQYKVCYCVLHGRIHWLQTWPGWPSPSSSFSSSPCSTWVTAVHLAPGRRLDSLEVPVHITHRSLIILSALVFDLFNFPPRRDAAAEESDVKTQIEKLWQEVNLLKEAQALQTGTVSELSECKEINMRGDDSRFKC